MKGLLYRSFRQSFASMMVIFGVQLALNICLIVLASISSPSTNESAANDIIFFQGVDIFATFFLITCTYSQCIFLPDEKHAWSFFTISSPLSMAGQIRSKFYFLLAECTVFVCIKMIFDTIICAAAGTPIVSANTVMTVLYCATLIYIAIEIPFMARYGTNVGTSIKTATFGAIVFIAAVYFLFGDIALFDEPDIIAAIMERLTQNRVLAAINIIMYAALPIYYLSYRLSVILYRKGVENYEN